MECLCALGIASDTVLLSSSESGVLRAICTDEFSRQRAAADRLDAGAIYRSNTGNRQPTQSV
jgi:hypothetical protein